MPVSRIISKWILPFAVLALAAAPLPAAAQSLAVEALELMLDDVRHAEDRRELIGLGEDLHEELTDEVNELQDVRDNTPGYLLRDDAGNYVSASQAEIADLGETLATDMVLADDRHTASMALLSRAEDGGDLDRAAANTLFSYFQLRLEGYKGGNIADYFVEAFTTLVREADRQNRDALDARIEELHALRGQVSGTLERAQAMQGAIVPAAPDAPEGFMNEPGYWVAQVSGSGWHKGGAGYATRIVGYENFIIQITDDVTEATRARSVWQLPPGSDLQAFERQRQEAAEESSRNSCESLPALGPRDPAPSIWDDGPHYEIVEGPIDDWAEALALSGNPRRNNNDPASNSFWDHDGGHRWDDLDPTCERYGVSLVD